MFSEVVLIEVLETFILVLTVVSKAVDSLLSSVIFGATLVDEGDSVLHSEEVDRGNVVLHRRNPFCDLGRVTPWYQRVFVKSHT